MQSAGQAAPAKPTFVVGAQVPPCCPRLEPVAQQEWKTRVGRPEAAVGSMCRMQQRSRGAPWLSLYWRVAGMLTHFTH